MNLRFVGGPHDGAYGELSVDWPEPPDEVWLVPDPKRRARWGVLISRRPCPHPRYEHAGMEDGFAVYEYGSLTDRMEAMDYAGRAT